MSHEALENEDGGELVNGGGSFLDRNLAVAQDTVGLGGGESLIPQVNGQLELGAELLGKGGHLLRLRAGLTAHAQRETDDDLADVVVVNQAPECSEISFLVAATDGLESLGGDPKGVSDRGADGAR